MLDPKDIRQLLPSLIEEMLEFLPPPIAFERALNLCWVIVGDEGKDYLRPACLWYNDIEYQESAKILESIDVNHVTFVTANGKVKIKGKTLNAPQTLIFRTDNQEAVKLTQNPKFDDNIFKNHRAIGQVLGYLCAGDPKNSQYHVRFAGWPNGIEHHEFTILEQMCRSRHRQEFYQLAQKMQDWVDRYRLGLEIHLFTTDRKSPSSGNP